MHIILPGAHIQVEISQMNGLRMLCEALWGACLSLSLSLQMLVKIIFVVTLVCILLNSGEIILQLRINCLENPHCSQLAEAVRGI